MWSLLRLSQVTEGWRLSQELGGYCSRRKVRRALATAVLLTSDEKGKVLLLLKCPAFSGNRLNTRNRQGMDIQEISRFHPESNSYNRHPFLTGGAEGDSS